MKLSLLLLVEAVAFVVAMVYCVLWFRNPDGPHEQIVTMCGLVGTVLVDIVRRKVGEEPSPEFNRIVRIEAEARYVVPSNRATIEEVWVALTVPFLERHRSWHPSYSDFEPVSVARDGKPREFEVRGLQGGIRGGLRSGMTLRRSCDFGLAPLRSHPKAQRRCF